MAYTCSDLISEVQSKIGDTSFSTVDLLNYANNTNRDVHTKHKLRYMHASQNYATIAGTPSLGALPVDLMHSYNLRITDLSWAKKLPNWTFDKFDERYPQPTLTGQSVPMLWYTYSNVVNLFPTPNAVYNLQLRYRKKPTSLTLAAQTPDVPEEFREVMLLGMLRQAFERRNRYDVAQLYDQQYQDRLLDLVDIYADGAFQDSDPYIIPTANYRG